MQIDLVWFYCNLVEQVPDDYTNKRRVMAMGLKQRLYVMYSSLYEYCLSFQQRKGQADNDMDGQENLGLMILPLLDVTEWMMREYVMLKRRPGPRGPPDVLVVFMCDEDVDLGPCHPNLFA